MRPAPSRVKQALKSNCAGFEKATTTVGARRALAQRA
jgi:hypothetical protein